MKLIDLYKAVADIKRIFKVPNPDVTAKLFGVFDRNVRILEEQFGVKISNRGSEDPFSDPIVIEGEDSSCESAYNALSYLNDVLKISGDVTEQNVFYAVNMIRDGRFSELCGLGDDCICITSRGKPIKAKTVGQQKYANAIRDNTVVIGVGPAGTGKTYLAVALAVKALRSHSVSRIVLTRPAVEAGERLGFLPGDLQSKIDPYLRPLYDALYDMLGAENAQRLAEKNAIEIAPLAYMRGRTLDDCFIILDEAQNTTPEQMKMFLTRLGAGSKAVVTGDLTQTDLPDGKRSGLAEAVKVLDGIGDISVQYLTQNDVVRHRLVQRIIEAYDRYEKIKKEKYKAKRKTGDVK